MGQRPRNARRSIPDPGGVVFPWAAGRKIGVTSPEIDPAPAGSDLVGGASSGGVAPGYSMDPLRGSRTDRSEGVLGAAEARAAGKAAGPESGPCATLAPESTLANAAGRRRLCQRLAIGECRAGGVLNRWERGDALHQEGARLQERNRYSNLEG